MSSNEFKLFPRNLKRGHHRIQSLKMVRNPHTFSDVIVGNKVAVRLLNGTQSSTPLLSFCYFPPSLVGGCFIHQCTKSQSPPPLCLPSFSLSLHSPCLSFSPRNRGQLCGAVQYLFSLLSRLSTCLHARTPARESATSPRNAPATFLPL